MDVHGASLAINLKRSWETASGKGLLQHVGMYDPWKGIKCITGEGSHPTSRTQIGAGEASL